MRIAKSDGSSGRSTILVDGSKSSITGATLANAFYIFASGHLDSYQMITRPGASVVSAGLAASEAEGRSGKELLTSLVVGYEVQTRITHGGLVPATAARGYRPSLIYGVMGWLPGKDVRALSGDVPFSEANGRTGGRLIRSGSPGRWSVRCPCTQPLASLRAPL